MAPVTENGSNTSETGDAGASSGVPASTETQNATGAASGASHSAVTSNSAEEGNRFDTDNFLSTLRDGIREDVHGKPAGLAEPQAMGRVKDLHSKLKTVVANLSDKVSIVLQKQENEFLAAYRAHMYNVQKELQELRAKVDDAELKMKKDSKISKLEDERDWYRKEALRLDSFATTMKKEMKYMKDKLESIEDDRTWLEKQLKTCKKQNKLLRAELEITMNGSQLREENTHEIKPTKESKNSNGNAQQPQLSTSSEFEQLTTSSELKNPSILSPNALGSPIPRSLLGSSEILEQQSSVAGQSEHQSQNTQQHCTALSAQDFVLPPTGSQVQTMRVREQIRQLRQQLESATSEIQELRATAVDKECKDSELETFFLTCIQDVKKDILRRRTKSMQGIPKARAALEVARQHQGITLAKFTSTDRRRVLDSLLSNGQVLGYIYDALFPPPDGSEQQDRGHGAEDPKVKNSKHTRLHKSNSQKGQRPNRKDSSNRDKQQMKEVVGENDGTKNSPSNNKVRAKRPDSPVEDHITSSQIHGSASNPNIGTSQKGVMNRITAETDHAASATSVLPALSSP